LLKIKLARPASMVTQVCPILRQRLGVSLGSHIVGTG
jgi:hypothetical protein